MTRMMRDLVEVQGSFKPSVQLPADFFDEELNRHFVESYIPTPEILDIFMEVRDSLQPKYHFLAARILDRQEEYEPATLAIQKALSREEPHLETIILAGKLFFLQKEYDQTIRLQNRALRISSQDPRPFYWKANVAIVRLDSSNALKYLREALNRHPKYPQVYTSFAQLYLKYEMNKRAIQYANTGLRLNPDNDSLYFYKAEAFRLRRFYFRQSLSAGSGHAEENRTLPQIQL